MIGTILALSIGLVGGLFLAAGITIVRPTERALVERFGKYSRFANPGISFVIPGIERVFRVNVTERMVDAEKQEIITKDNLNAMVDAVVYFRVQADESNVRNSQYNVDDVDSQIVSLARTTLRNIIGGMTLTEANSERSRINKALQTELSEETKDWGIQIVRTELKEIDPPEDVQIAMNGIVKAENEKRAAKDLAEAAETRADGERRAKVQMAKGEMESAKLQAEGKAKAIELESNAKANAVKVVNEAVEKSFGTKAQLLRRLEAMERCLSDNTKIVLPNSENLVNVLSDGESQIIPVKGGKIR